MLDSQRTVQRVENIGRYLCGPQTDVLTHMDGLPCSEPKTLRSNVIWAVRDPIYSGSNMVGWGQKHRRFAVNDLFLVSLSTTRSYVDRKFHLLTHSVRLHRGQVCEVICVLTPLHP